jgi:TPR repeat protein
MESIGHIWMTCDVPDPRTAAVWFEKAGALGDAQAMFALGEMYHMGEGVTRDLAAAAAWYGKAEKCGHSGARIAMERMIRR